MIIIQPKTPDYYEITRAAIDEPSSRVLDESATYKLEVRELKMSLYYVNDEQIEALVKGAAENLIDQPSSQQMLKRIVYLTIDDGPTSSAPKFLDLLKRYGIKVTFFVLEPNVRRYPEAVKRMLAEGHILGIHGVTHDKDKFYRSKESLLHEVERTRKTIKEVSGVDTVLVRTPYGSVPFMTPTYKKVLEDNGYKMWDWNIDTRDWYFGDLRYVASAISQLKNLGNNEAPVILIHDRVATVEYLPELLDYLLANNYEFGTLRKEMKPVQLY